MESLRTPVFSQRPFPKPEGKAIDLPPCPDTCVGAKAHYVRLQGQGADPSMGLSPSQTVGGPGEASFLGCHPTPPCPQEQFWPRLSIQELMPKLTRPASPLPVRAPLGAAELLVWLSGLRRCGEASSSCFASLHFTGEKRLRFSVLHPHPFPLLRMLCLPPEE